MKTSLILAALASTCMFTASASAQWSLNGVKTYYNAGNVGIGTDDPAHALDVRSAGERAIFGYSTPISGMNYGVYGQTDSTQGRAIYGLAASGVGTNYAIVGKTNSVTGYAGWFAGGRNYFEGRVGIGGANPSQKLQVNGNIKVSGWIGNDTNVPVDFFTNNNRCFRIQWATVGSVVGPNIIGGLNINTVAAGVVGATIGGGGVRDGATLYAHTVGTKAHYATIGGGLKNKIAGTASIFADNSAIGGGFNNSITNQRGTIGGGANNVVSNGGATVCGGESNTASGASSTVAGGITNVAGGFGSFAAGSRALANHDGAFVWGDSTNLDVVSAAANQFTARAAGGVRFFTNGAMSLGAKLNANATAWTIMSDRAVKRDITPVDCRQIAERLAGVPISTWKYIDDETGVLHMGPMAQDFHAAFGLGDDDKSISTLDADGVMFAAIQGLHQLVKEKDSQITTLRTEKDSQISQQQRQIDELTSRLARLEAAFAQPKVQQTAAQ